MSTSSSSSTTSSLFGYMGKILRVNLTTGDVKTIDTSQYSDKFMGGFGIGAAIYFDLVADKTISAYDPRNVVCVMTGPLSGTLAPTSGRTEMCGKGSQGYPTEWFTRSGFGGRWGPMLKFAGWDGVVIEGKAAKPSWIWISDSDVEIKDASGLWGMTTYDTQEAIFNDFGGGGYGSWISMEKTGQRGRQTTQRPAVLTIGPAGENLSRIGCVTHDSASTAGQGGFGGVWGSKNLKAIGVIGSGGVKVADSKDLISMRKWLTGYQYDFIALQPGGANFGAFPRPPGAGEGVLQIPGQFWQTDFVRPLGCFGCMYNCRGNYTYQGLGGGESQCVEAVWYLGPDMMAHGNITDTSYKAACMLTHTASTLTP